MLKSEFAAINPNGTVVDEAKTAEQIKSGLTAPNGTFYGKNEEGEFEWLPVSSVEVPDHITTAEHLASEEKAANSTFYGKGIDGSVGFKEISEISPQVMLKSTYDPENTGHFSLPVSEETPVGSV